MIEDVVPDDAWKRLPLTQERYLPWDQMWFQRTGLLLATNAALFPFGMQMLEIYSEHGSTDSVGFDVKGSGRYPMPPLIWSSPDLIQSVANFRRLITPRVEDPLHPRNFDD